MRHAGAIFELTCDADRRQWNYRWRLAAGGDGALCKCLTAKAKADPEFYGRFKVAVFVAIARDAWQLPESSP